MLSSCGIKEGYLKLKQTPDELIAPERIRAFLKENPNPSIVLRVPQSTSGATQADPNSHLYTAIEKELVLQGFNLKDRGLFNQVLNSQAGLDYSKINELTGTDLILELIKVDRKVPFNTNIAYTKKNVETVLQDINYLRYGALIEFKLILVKNNEHGGSYTFTITPCTELNNDCQCKVPYKFSKKFYSESPILNICFLNQRNINNAPPTAYQTIPDNVVEDFVREGVKKVVEAIRR
jgi:hypothetical protein